MSKLVLLAIRRNRLGINVSSKTSQQLVRNDCLLSAAPRPSTRALHTTTILGSTQPEPVSERTQEPAHIKAIVDQIAQLRFHEVTILNEALKRELKIPDVQRVVAAPGAAGAPSAEDDTAAAGALKTAFTVKLTKFDESKKVALIKEIKKLVEGINLVEAKRFVEECPRVVRANLSKDDAESLQKQLEAAGGVVKLE